VLISQRQTVCRV